MNYFYKPSGKISPLFVLFLPLWILLAVPVISFIYSVFLWYSPFVMLSLGATVVCVFALALLGGHWTVTKGKVRNKTAAIFSAVLTGMLCAYFTAVIYCAFNENCLNLEGIAALITNPRRLLTCMNHVLDDGITVSRGNTSLFTLKGNSAAMVLGAGFLLAQVIIIFVFRINAIRPFNESRKQWAKEITLNFGWIEDKADFISRMHAGDIDYINSIPVFKQVNADHSSFQLYVMENSYHLSVKNCKANAPEKNGDVKFTESTLFQYLSIGKQAGDLLISRQVHTGRESGKAKIVSKSTKRREGRLLLRNVAAAGLFFFAAYQAYRTGQIDAAMFSGPVILFCTAAFFLYFLFCTIGSFMKEDVIVLEENMLDEGWHAPDALTNAYRIEQRDSGLAYKIFYLIMLILSAGVLVFIMLK